MNTPKVSVIIPIYNCEVLIAKCLDSLLEQTLNDFEVICVDDGSTDGSLKILKSYAKKDKKIKFICQKNQGQSVARNNALKQANGKYIAFVDADDYVSPNFLLELVERAEATNADVACTSIIRIEDGIENKLLSHKQTVTAKNINDIFKIFGIPKFCYIWNKVYLREFILQNNLFFPENVYYEDIIWSTLVASKVKKVVSVTKGAYYYVYNKNSIVATTKNDTIKANDLHNAWLFYDKFVLENKIKAPLRFEKIHNIKIVGISLIKVKEVDDLIKQYYLCGIPIVSKKTKKNF